MTDQDAIDQLRAKGYNVETVQPANYAALEQRIEAIENRTGLLSKSFMTRIYTVWGYYLLANIWIGLVLVVLAAIFGWLR